MSSSAAIAAARPCCITALAAIVVLAGCAASGPSTDVRAAACDYVETASDRDFADRELAAYQLASQGDFDDFLALGPERQARFERLLSDVETIGSYEPMSESAGTTATALEDAIAAGAEFIESPSGESLSALADAFAMVRDVEQPFLADLREEVPSPCE